MVVCWQCLTSRSHLQEKVRQQRRLIVTEFKKMAALLVEEEERLLQALRQEEQDTAARLRESMVALEQQSCSLETLLLRLEDCSTREPLQMLQVRLTCSPGWLGGHTFWPRCGGPARANTDQQGRLCLHQLRLCNKHHGLGA